MPGGRQTLSPEATNRTARQARDEWLALRCQLGEPGAFADLVREMERPLLYYVSRLLGDEDRAIGLLQEVWVRVFRTVRRLEEPRALRAWLYRIAHGLVVDRVRHEAARERAERAWAEAPEGDEGVMEPRQNDLREGLLAQQAPDPDKFARYRKEMEAMIEENERGLRREKRYVTVMWFFLVAMAVTFLTAGGFRSDRPLGTFFGISACAWLLFGSVELLKHFVNRSRVEILKEVKHLEMQVLELREELRTRTGP
jgi:DNA-directed RNA polymerase specialized sigma24 family protein